VLDLTNRAQPTRPIVMAGDVPIPIPITPPVIPPPPFPAPPIPHIGNPVPYVVHGAEAAWSDVAGWVSDRWRNLLNIGGSLAQTTFNDVQNIVDVALSAEQTAWASFVSTLESWINASIASAEGAIADLSTFVGLEMIALWEAISAGETALFRAVWDAVYGIDQTIARQWWDTVASIDDAIANVEAWAIDDIYNPLLADVWGAISWADARITNVADWLQAEIDDINLRDIPGILARLGALAGAIALLEAWVEECGGPMCEQFGPNTDFSKLWKILDIAGMLALFAAFSNLTEDQLETLATTIVGLGERPAETFVEMFVTEGDTLGEAILSSVPSIALP
jgi:hypothetical protein